MRFLRIESYGWIDRTPCVLLDVQSMRYFSDPKHRALRKSTLISKPILSRLRASCGQMLEQVSDQRRLLCVPGDADHEIASRPCVR